MQLPIEIQKVEILDWWETEREQISQDLQERLPALYYKVDRVIEEMPVKALIRKGQHHTETLEPLVIEWMEKVYRDLTHELDESFRSSAEAVEGDGAHDQWTYSEMATAGAALAVSVAPIAGIPFFAGGLTAAGVTVLGITVGSGGLLALPVAALAGSAILLAAGPTARWRAVAALKARYRDAVHSAIEKRVLGDESNTDSPSLKDKLQGELLGVALQRMEMAG